MKAVISGYGRMGHMVEGILLKHGIEIAAATEDVCSKGVRGNRFYNP